MRKTATRVLVCAIALIGMVIVRPEVASAYPTTYCEDTPEKETRIYGPGRAFFIGIERTTPADDPEILFGARLCIELNNGSGNVFGIDIGFALFGTTQPTEPDPGLVLVLDVCGYPTESTCVRALQHTGIIVDPDDQPKVTLDCDVTVGSTCIGDPTIEYGSSPTPTLTIWVYGIPVPINVNYDCVSVPGC